METIKADDCMKQAMTEIKDKHPEMKHDQMVAIALSKCGKSNKKAFQGMLDQVETNYKPLSPDMSKACASCRWFMVGGCFIVENYPEPILPTGYCDRWEATPAPPPEPDVAPIPVTIVEPMDDSMEMALPTTRRGFVDFITDTIKSILNPEPPPEPVFSVFKAMNGKKYWLARHTGKYVDREQEIIADKAHEEYVDRVQKGLVPLPELWCWHKKGTRHGQADFVWKAGGFVLALGHFDDTPAGEKAFAYYQKQRGKIKLSHMFHYPKRAKQGRVFHAYNTVEITTLPAGAEAFPYTSFEELPNMALTKEQKEMIEAIGGAEMVQRAETLDKSAHADTATLDDKGVESKGLDNFDGATIPASPDVEALKVIQVDFETRLKAMEALPTTVQSAFKTLSDQLAAIQQTQSDALKKANDLEAKLLEYQALKPPASSSTDTLLAAREKSLIESMMAQAKAENTPSLVEMALGGRPAVTEQ